MNSTVCTLFEGDYHYGVGALVNSLYAHGFRGTVWAGYRGTLPSWASPLAAKEGYQELKVAPDCVINFVPLKTTLHFAAYKPNFLLQVLKDLSPTSDAVFYFDPDIVNKGNYDFYERWVTRGIALCEDAWAFFLTPDHPIRQAWQEYVEERGFTCERSLSRYYNAGFVGVHRNHIAFLSTWMELMALFNAEDVFMKRGSEHRYPYINAYDQDAMNIALMVTSEPTSTVGPEAMDFNTSGFLMSHAAGGNVVKPWRKQYVSKALSGVPPSSTDKLFWQQTQSPIQLYSKAHQAQKERSLRLSSAIGRLIRRAY